MGLENIKQCSVQQRASTIKVSGECYVCGAKLSVVLAVEDYKLWLDGVHPDHLVYNENESCFLENGKCKQCPTN